MPPAVPFVVTLCGWSLDAPDEQRLAWLRSLLTDDERRRADRLVTPERARRWLAARGTLRELLGEAVGAPPAELRFDVGPGGKPRLVGGGPEFNLAHSDGWGVLAVAAEAVGIDLERPREVATRDALARRWFAPSELARFLATDDPQREFFRLWTAKEAVVKLAGVGVGELLRAFATPSGDGWVELPEEFAPAHAERRCWLSRLDGAQGLPPGPFPPWPVALATWSGAPRVEWRRSLS
ncbi:MAG: 4'-phosphopantetheinyl transferase family protein [Lacipirellulaceae bacterium]